MARYIDADKVHEGIEAIQISFESNDDRVWRKNKPYYKGLAMARGVIDELPTADVAPRAEVAREIFEEISIILSEHYGKASEKTDLKLLEPLRQAKRFVINEISDDIAELKKKYTEGEK